MYYTLAFINSQSQKLTLLGKCTPCRRNRVRGSKTTNVNHLDLPIINHAPTLGSPTRICANCPGSDAVAAAAASHGARAPISIPPGLALAGPPPTASVGVLTGPYGFGSEFWRCRPCVTMCAGKALEGVPEKDVACCCCGCCTGCCCGCCPSAPVCGAAAVGGECAFVMPGTEIKYTEPVGSVPPWA